MKKLIYALIILSFVQCNKNKSTTPTYYDIEYINYGTSFGECIGFCINEATINDSIIVFQKKGWDTINYPTILLTENIDKYYWTSLKNNINIDAFMKTFKISGCPDCVDGGSEWVEIKANGQIHKVTFEYMNAPESIEPFIGYLRTYMGAFNVNNNQSIDFNNRILIDQMGTIKAFEANNDSFQYVIETTGNNNTTYYYSKYLGTKNQINNLPIRFCGVLQYDSIQIYKPSSDGSPTPFFKARNIVTFDITK